VVVICSSNVNEEYEDFSRPRPGQLRIKDQLPNKGITKDLTPRPKPDQCLKAMTKD